MQGKSSLILLVMNWKIVVVSGDDLSYVLQSLPDLISRYQICSNLHFLQCSVLPFTDVAGGAASPHMIIVYTETYDETTDVHHLY